MKTITLSDATFNELATAMAAASSPAPPPPPPSVPGAVVVPWKTMVGGGYSVACPAGPGVVFKLSVPIDYSSNGKLCSFRISPTNAGGYVQRHVALSDAPFDYSRKLGSASVAFGQEPTIYFSVNGYPIDKYGRIDKTCANLMPGYDYYFSVMNRDSTGNETCPAGQPCSINYGLTLC